jgi:hypothetical protein
VLAASADVMRRAGAEAAASPRLVMSYEASQPTGWEQPYNQTIGGHLASKEITYHQKKYRNRRRKASDGLTALPAVDGSDCRCSLETLTRFALHRARMMS